MYWTDFNIIGFIAPLFVLLLVNQCIGRNSIAIRNVILLMASIFFYYGLSSTFVFLLAFVTSVNYIAGLLLLKKQSRAICGVTVFVSLLPLLFFKYANFLITDVLHIGANNLSNVALPIGISFFTFQALTYTIDIYRAKIQYKTTFVNYALFVCFFPTVMSGPIEKARNMLGQLNSKSPITLTGVVSGFQIFVWGLFKKVVVADLISGYVNNFYYAPESYTGNSYILAILLYSIQIYCDFSGYSDMSIGIARAIGFRLAENFNYPYFSTTIGQFWKKWHISLTSWFTEYLYISCGGNRVVKWRWVLNIVLVFIISGLWHGAAWTFIIWGILHAILYLIEHFINLKSKELKLPRKLLQTFYVYMAVSLAWVFFRANSMDNAWAVIKGICHPWGDLYFGSSVVSFVIMAMSLLIFILFEILTFIHRINIYNEQSCGLWRNQLFTTFMLLMVSLFGQTGASFVYSQF